MTAGILTAEDRARARESRRLNTTPKPSIPKAPREDEPPAVWPAWALKLRHELTAEIKRLEDENWSLKASIMETERARAEAQNNTNALTLYGESKEVKDLTARLEFMLPNAQEIGTQGVAMLAQIAIAHGLDPLPGSDHVYAWKQGGKLMVAIGYKGLLHLARQQVQFTHQSRPMTDDERAEYGVKEGQIAYITELYEIAKAAQCQQIGIPYHPIIGTAVWAEKVEHKKKTGEIWYEYNDPPSGKTGAWVCRKNSLKDALRQIARTGVRMGAALDAAFQQQAVDWSLPLAQQTGEAPDVQMLIAAGVIQDDDEAPSVVEGAAVEPRAAMPPEGVCDRCMARPVDPASPFGLCAECSQIEAAKDIAKEPSQPALFKTPRAAESDVPRKK